MSLLLKLDIEKKNHEDEVLKLRAEVDQQREQIQSLTTPRNNLDYLHKSIVDSFPTFERSHKLTMDDLQKKRGELEESQTMVEKLKKSLASKFSALKSLRTSSKAQSEELEVMRHNIGVLESDRKVQKAAYDNAMDKVVRVGRLLAKKSDVIVPEDIVMAIPSVSKLDAGDVSRDKSRSASDVKDGVA